MLKIMIILNQAFCWISEKKNNQCRSDGQFVEKFMVYFIQQEKAQKIAAQL